MYLLLPPLNLRRDPEYNLLDHNAKCKDCECDSAYVKHRSDSVYDKSKAVVVEVSTRVFSCSAAEKHFFPDCTFEQGKIMKKNNVEALS